MSFLILVVAIVLFIGLIITHELGHFLVARRNGVVVEEFGIFFPPRLYKRVTKKGWLFSINLLPLGGFVKMKGEHDTDVEPGSFGAASTWSKTKIMIAGVMVNLITGIFLLTILAWLGMPQIVPNQFDIKGASHVSRQEVLVYSVQKGSPAQKIGLKAENEIVALGRPGHPTTINSISDLQTVTKQYAGQRVEIVYRNNGNQRVKFATLQTQTIVASTANTKNPKGYLGVSLVSLTIKKYSWWSAPVEALGLTWQVIKLTFVGLGHALAGLGKIIAGIVTGNNVARQHGQKIASSQVAGPIGIFVILKDGSVLGYQYMLFIISIVALTLAIMNFLPIPALDGGRMWLMLISRAFGMPLTASFEELVNAIGMIVLLVLVALVTLVDVHRFL